MYRVSIKKVEKEKPVIIDDSMKKELERVLSGNIKKEEPKKVQSVERKGKIVEVKQPVVFSPPKRDAIVRKGTIDSFFTKK